MAVLDLKRPHRMIGPVDDEGHKWAMQDGRIFGWSESNCCFETVWWLNDEGKPVTDVANPGHIEAILRERPFDPAWLKEG